jgi:hypothetical protein
VKLSRFWREEAAGCTSLFTGITTDSLGLAIGTGSAALAALYGAPWLLSKMHAPDPDGEWWSNTNILEALMVAEILPTPKEGERPPVIRYYGRVSHDANGSEVKIGLPKGYTWTRVKPKREALASAFGVPLTRFELTQHSDDAPNVFYIWIGKKGPRPPRSLEVTAPWGEPRRVGQDERGLDIYIPTKGVHTGIVGQTGSGKTWFGRGFVAPAIADPNVELFAIIGKNDIGDWSAMKPCCSLYIGCDDDEDYHEIEKLLRHLRAVSRKRIALPPAERTPVVVVVEEWYAIRVNSEVADKDLSKRLDQLLGSLLATARSANFHVVMLGQRGTVQYLPSDQRANLGSMVVGKVKDPNENRYALGRNDLPPVTPSKPGQFLVQVEGSQEPVLMRADILTDEEFVDLCKRAAKLRQADAKPPLELPDDDDEPIDPSSRSIGSVEFQDDLHRAVLTHLAAVPDATAGEILDTIPTDAPWRPRSRESLGHKLARMPGVEPGERTPQRRSWRIEGGDSARQAVLRSAQPSETVDGVLT